MTVFLQMMGLAFCLVLMISLIMGIVFLVMWLGNLRADVNDLKKLRDDIPDIALLNARFDRINKSFDDLSDSVKGRDYV